MVGTSGQRGEGTRWSILEIEPSRDGGSGIGLKASFNSTQASLELCEAVFKKEPTPK